MKKLGIILIALVACSLLTYRFAPGFILDTMEKAFVLQGGFDKEVTTVDGYTTHYLDNHQTGKPLIVFLHGYMDRKEAWFPFVNAFTDDYHIIIPDLLGHGENTRDTTLNYSFESQAAFVHGFLQDRKTPDCHLVGISMGGGVAGAYASLYSDHLLSVSFISAAGMVGCAKRSELEKTMLTFKTLQEKRDRFPLLPLEYTDETMKEFKRYLVHRDIFMPVQLLREYIQLDAEERNFFTRVLADFIDVESGKFLQPLDDKLATISCPSQVIWGKQDMMSDASCADVFKERLPNLKDFVLLDDCGHVAILEQPEKTELAVTNFLANNTPIELKYSED
ncbi:alpha/beta fold hydrolase [Bacteroidota bacterium]